MTPKLGDGIENISSLNSNELAWSTEAKKTLERNNSYEIKYEDKNLEPWKLILKK